MKNDIFNDAYINCRFSCLYNILNYYELDPMYVIANNYYLIDDVNYSIKNIYYLPYEELFKILGIKTKKIKLIKSVNDIKLKHDEIAILKIQGVNDNLTGDKTSRSNMIILNTGKDTSNLIWRDSSNTKVFKYMEMSNHVIDEIYYKYLDKYYSKDKEPTLNIFSKCKTKKNSFNKLFKPHMISYKLFIKYEKDIKQNEKKLKKLLNSSSNEKIIEFISIFNRIKKAELYKFKILFPKKKIYNIIERQIEILEILGYYIYKQSPKKEILIEELISLENKISKEILKIKVKDILDSNIRIKKI